MMTSTAKRAVIGIDVGGTNTDAVVLNFDKDSVEVLASYKTPTTQDVTSGVRNALISVINNALEESPIALAQINIGTTHFVNAVVQRKNIVRVGVIRLCGPLSSEIPPFTDIPEDLQKHINGGFCLANGGYDFDGREISKLEKEEIFTFLKEITDKGVSNVVVSGIFSPVRIEHEEQVYRIIKEYNSELSVTLSHNIGQIGLLQRENAAILNEALKPLCRKTIEQFNSAVTEMGILCPIYLTKNDGTIIQRDLAIEYPVLAFSSGPTNSMRGAAYLSGLKEAIVIDIGGTTTDVGLIAKGFPRLSSTEIKIGGIRTNFSMPDVRSIGLGGGSYVRQDQGRVVVGPESAGLKILEESLVFADPENIKEKQITATDISVAAKITRVGNSENVQHLEHSFVEEAVKTIRQMLEDCIDEAKITARDLPAILVGGGHILVDKNQKLVGVSELVIPEHSEVANAIGAALSQVSGNVEYVKSLEELVNNPDTERIVTEAAKPDMSEEEKENAKKEARKVIYENVHKTLLTEARQLAFDSALKAGAEEKSLYVLEEGDIPLSYLPGNVSKFYVKVIGDLDILHRPTYLVSNKLKQTDKHSRQKETIEVSKQIYSSTGSSLFMDSDSKPTPDSPVFNSDGEWILSEFDVECISVGAGILGSGGGGPPYLGKLKALKSLKEGKQIRVADPVKMMEQANSENDLVVIIAIMGAPVIAEERLCSKECQDALQCMKNVYSDGYSNGEIPDSRNSIRQEGNVMCIDNYQYSQEQVTDVSSKLMGKKKIAGVMSAEIGGMNAVEPFTVAADMNLPVLDCDGMGRAFPELQMFLPLIEGMLPYPSTLADAKGRRSVVLKCDTAKELENYFRKVVVEMGCLAGVIISSLQKHDVLNKTVMFTTSLAWRLGKAVINARHAKKSTAEAVLAVTGGKVLMVGKISNVIRKTEGGFNTGHVAIKSITTEHTLKVEFQNENLVALLQSGKKEEVVAMVPDLITIIDSDNGEPIPTEAVRYGLRVTVLTLPAHASLRTDRALAFVGPAAFGYSHLDYKPCGEPMKPISVHSEFLHLK